jgi:hypothetical protein
MSASVYWWRRASGIADTVRVSAEGESGLRPLDHVVRNFS